MKNSLLIFFISLSIIGYGQKKQSFDNLTGYLIKVDGNLNYVASGTVETVRGQVSFKNGLLIKPEGVIILKSGQELVLKNGEILDHTFIVKKANDSTMNEIRFKQLFNSFETLRQDHDALNNSVNLLKKKLEILDRKTDLINKKAEMCLSRSETSQSSQEMKELNREIIQTKRELKEINRSLSRSN